MRLRLPVTLLTLLALAACRSEPKSGPERFSEQITVYEERILDVVADPGTVDACRTILSELETTFLDQQESVRRKREELRTMARQYDVTEEDLETELARLTDATLAMHALIENGHFRLRHVLTEGEWNAVVDPPSRFLGVF